MHAFYHALNLVPGMSYKSLWKLWRKFRSWKYAFTKPSFQEYVEAGLSESLSLKIIETRKIFDVEHEYGYLDKAGITLILRNDSEFPNSLKNIPWPPFGLYRKGVPLVRGQTQADKTWLPEQVQTPEMKMGGTHLSARSIAIVGTRIPSAYGAKMAYEIAEKIAVSGGVIVSGLAFGIDAAAHRGAVKNYKPTIAVLASGLDTITPSNHLSLAQSIVAAGGTLLSEYATGNASYKGNFLARNRLISGLSQATIVIEAKEKSGALITARHALEQGRDLYALVGDITRLQAQGCLHLLMQGAAQPIFSVEELMMQLGFNLKQAILKQLSNGEMAVFSLLKNKAFSTEELVVETGFEMWELAGILTQLEVKELIRKNVEGRWLLINKEIISN